jgi:hypothetical protein
MARLDRPHWSAIAPISPLRACRLLEVRNAFTPATSSLLIDERVLHYLVGINYLDDRLRPFIRDCAIQPCIASAHERLVKDVVSSLHVSAGRSLIRIDGRDRGAISEVARLIAHACNRRLRTLQAEVIPSSASECLAMASLWNRDSELLGGALLIVAENESAKAAARLCDSLTGLVFVTGINSRSVSVDLHVEVPQPDQSDRSRLWRDLLGAPARQMNGAVDALAAQFQLDTESIAHSVREFKSSLSGSDDHERLLRATCQRTARHRLDGLAQRIEPLATWQDLVLPDPQTSMLRQVAAHVRGRHRVMHEWGFARVSARGTGVSVLFSGEAGTGKTMAAEVLANDLELDLYRVDLSAVVSKYIGETEKNLRRVFDAADESGVILLFDEADALFGKRTEVKDSNDRYANVEVSYLLQRMEEYRGLAILTTNLKNALDAAFHRRLRFVVQFPFPDQLQREDIWRRAFPPQTPVLDLDHRKLARLNVAGGSIRSIALNAAYQAAHENGAVSMRHLLAAARSEASKRERPFSEAEIRGWS